MSERGTELRMRARRGMAIVAGSVALTACSPDTSAIAPDTVTVTVTPSSMSSVRGPKGPCEPFSVYAQNRWSPQGASEREAPDIRAKKIGSFAGNEVITVDGWADTHVDVYPNPDPWKGRTWLHTVDGGWVTTAAVRKEPTVFDPTSSNKYGGVPVELKPECEIHLR